VQRFDWGRFVEVIDVGGGNGTLLGALLPAHPGLRGHAADTVIDLPNPTPSRPPHNMINYEVRLSY
jgi:hypothetical protein